MYLIVFKCISSSIEIVSLGFYRVCFMGCCFFFVCLSVIVILKRENAFEKLVVSHYQKLLLTRSCPYQLLLLQNMFPYMELKECLLPRVHFSYSLEQSRWFDCSSFFSPHLQPLVPIFAPCTDSHSKAIQKTKVTEI